MALAVKDLPASAGDIRDAGLIPGLGRSPEGGHGNPTPVFLPGARQPALVFLPGKPHGQRNLGGYGPWGHTELDPTEVM